MKSFNSSRWCAYHVFYGGNLDRLLTSFVLPAVGSLLADGQVDRFFFIRYFSGGPHIRLRLRQATDCTGFLDTALMATAAVFFERWTSNGMADEESLRELSRSTMDVDLDTKPESAKYPDNSLLPFRFMPETERYGGNSLIEHSLDFFGFSSIQALSFAKVHGGSSRSRQLPIIFRILVRQALGLAESEEEFLYLLSYAAGSREPTSKFFTTRGDDSFERRRSAFIFLFHSEIEELLNEDYVFDDASFRFSRDLAIDERTRGRILASHMHMTANRLGLNNAEEAYLGRMMWRSAREAIESSSSFRTSLHQSITRSTRLSSTSPCSLERLLPSALSSLFPELGKSVLGPSFA